MTAPKPMATALLAELRTAIEGQKCGLSYGLALTLQDLMRDRDHHAKCAEQWCDEAKAFKRKADKAKADYESCCALLEAECAETSRLSREVDELTSSHPGADKGEKS